MPSKAGKTVILLIIMMLLACFAAGSSADGEAFEIRRIGNIHPYAENAFLIRSEEGGELTIRVHDSICVYRTINGHIQPGETTIRWDGCGYNREKLYEKTYTITADLVTDAGVLHTISFSTPIEYPLQCLQYALPSSEELYLDSLKEWFLEYRTVTDGTVCMEMRTGNGGEPACSFTFKAQGGKIKRRDFTEIAGKKKPEKGEYTVSVYEISRPDEIYEFPLRVSGTAPERMPVAVTGEIMPDRNMTDEDIWDMMMRPSVVVDIDFFDHQQIYEEPDTGSRSLGTLHGQTQGLKVIRAKDGWALIGAWNHEDAAYVEGWVPYENLKTELPAREYGILIDKRSQTLSVYRNGKKIDTLLVSTGRPEKKHLYQETSAGCFLTGYHRVNFSMNGKKYDYVFQYDGGNLLHQTPYDWGQQKKDFTLGRGYLGAKASHACVRIQPEPGEGGLNAFWLFTHIPYHTRVIILDDPDEREASANRLARGTNDDLDISSLYGKETSGTEKDEDTVTITFGGRLTPGGTGSFNTRKGSFVSFVSQKGYGVPLSGLKQFFEADDLTCVNLTGLIGSYAQSAPKGKEIPHAPEMMRELFREASVELAQMTEDLLWNAGGDAPEDTAIAIGPYAASLGGKISYTTEIKGCRFGFAGCSEKEYLRDPGIIDRRIAGLKDSRCERIIFLASWGEDNASGHSIVQEAMAHRSIRAGADLVIGSCRGSVQGIDFFEGVPVVYSTGELLDGSTAAGTRQQQGILVRAVFTTGTENDSVSLEVIPVLPYGHEEKNRNGYRPAADLDITEAESVIRSVWKDTADQFMDRVTFRLPDQ